MERWDWVGVELGQLNAAVSHLRERLDETIAASKNGEDDDSLELLYEVVDLLDEFEDNLRFYLSYWDQ